MYSSLMVDEGRIGLVAAYDARIQLSSKKGAHLKLLGLRFMCVYGARFSGRMSRWGWVGMSVLLNMIHPDSYNDSGSDVRWYNDPLDQDGQAKSSR